MVTGGIAAMVALAVLVLLVMVIGMVGVVVKTNTFTLYSLTQKAIHRVATMINRARNRTLRVFHWFVLS